jgi:hypothetical protein
VVIEHGSENKMIPYGNLSGDSGVVAYESGDGFIKVQFRNDSRLYVYDSVTPGSGHLNQMQALAAAGRGLSTYISQHVKENYSRIEAANSWQVLTEAAA